MEYSFSTCVCVCVCVCVSGVDMVEMRAEATYNSISPLGPVRKGVRSYDMLQ